jgi:hypothetical protein
MYFYYKHNFLKNKGICILCDLWTTEKYEKYWQTIQVNMEWKHKEYGMEDV